MIPISDLTIVVEDPQSGRRRVSEPYSKDKNVIDCIICTNKFHLKFEDKLKYIKTEMQTLNYRMDCPFQSGYNFKCRWEGRKGNGRVSLPKSKVFFNHRAK